MRGIDIIVKNKTEESRKLLAININLKFNNTF